MSEFHVDILSIAGIEHTTFYNGGEDVRVEEDRKPVARVFRRGGKLVYRAGTAVEWDGEEGHPVS